MTLSEFLHRVMEEDRFKRDMNVMDRDVKVTIQKADGYTDVNIDDFFIDYSGAICIIIDEPEEADA